MYSVLGAISSIAFGQPSTLVDGNVIRVFARLCQKALPRDDKNLHAFSWEVAGKVLHHKVWSLSLSSVLSNEYLHSTQGTGIKR